MDNYRIISGDEICVAPSFGCNLFSWISGGREVFYKPAEFTGKMKQFYAGGNPILFPAVGRTWDCSQGEPVLGIYEVYGEKSKLSMPLHGILTLTEWSRVECIESPESVLVSYALMVPDIVKELSFPFDLELTQTFALTPNTLEMNARIRNTGSKTAPYAYGLHPYFVLPNIERESVSLELPSSTQLVLDKRLLVPTGETKPTPSKFNLEKGMEYDCVYGSLTGKCATLNDAGDGRRVVVEFDENIENIVVYADSKTPAVCIEPWTRGLDTYSELAKKDWEKSGAINTLQPGEECNIKIQYHVENL